MSRDTATNDNALSVATLLFRLLRNAAMHDIASLEAQGVLDTAASSLQQACQQAGGFVTLLFVDDSTVFANGQPVRASRAVYDNVLDVGAHLGQVNCNELTVRSTVSGRDVGVLLRIVGKRERGIPLPTSMSLQMVDPSALLDDEEELTVTQQVAAMYGAAVVLVRRCNEQVIEDELRPLRHVKRVAQRLVALSERGFPELLALARRPPPSGDKAAIAVSAGIIATLTMRSLSRDIHVALRAAMSAFQSDIGRPRVAGMYRDDGFKTPFVPQLNQQMRQRLPASTSVMLLEAGGGAERPMLRAVAAFEAAQLADAELLGWPYEGQIPPSVEAIIASLAVRVASAMSEHRSPDEVAAVLGQLPLGKIEQAGLELIYSVLGLMPVGSPVEMSDGRRGVVVSAGASFTQLERPNVVVLLDQRHARIPPQVVRAGQREGFVRALIAMADYELNSAYKSYLETRSAEEPLLPSTTGIIEPEEADQITDRASLHFEVDEATGRIDGAAAAAFIVPDDKELPSAPRQRFSSFAGEEIALPNARSDSNRPSGLSEPSAPAIFDRPASGPKQFETFRPSGVPSQFSQPAPAAEPVNAPSQFAKPSSPSGATNVPSQFASTPPASDSQPSGAPRQFQRPDAKPNDVWGGPKAPVPQPEPKSPEKKSDEDDDDDDFDALANILLFD